MADIYSSCASSGKTAENRAAVVRERPILFSAPMVRAILAGTKTQTRRVVKGDVEKWEDIGLHIVQNPCPYGVPGDRLWVRETWNYTCELTRDEQEKQSAILDRFAAGKVTDIVAEAMALPIATGAKRAMYAADFGEWAYDRDSDLRWRASIHMPRWASRITLEITDIRVQRLQEISEEEAKAEGCDAGDDMHNELFDPNTGRMTCGWIEPAPNAKESFCNLWQRIHKRPRGEETAWEENPWVWAVSFKHTTESRIGKPADNAQVE